MSIETGSDFGVSPLYSALPTSQSFILPGFSVTPAQILTSSASFTLPSNVLMSGSPVSTINLVGTTYTTGNVWNAYLMLTSGSVTSLGTSGSVYWFDNSPDGITWFGSGSAIANSGSTNVMGRFIQFNFSGSAPYWRFNLKNQSSSAITAQFVMIGR